MSMLRFLDSFMPRSVLPVKDLGRAGERRAAWFYRWRGFEILAENVRDRRGEIDLVARRGTLVVFAEVKTRQGTRMGEPWEAVDRPKELRIAEIAEGFLHQRRLDHCMMRFDVLSLVWNGWRFEVTHFPNAYELEADPHRPWIDR
jgi:putative endonuclease